MFKCKGGSSPISSEEMKTARLRTKERTVCKSARQYERMLSGSWEVGTCLGCVIPRYLTFIALERRPAVSHSNLELEMMAT